MEVCSIARIRNDRLDFSVLNEFRDRLIEGGKSKQILDKIFSEFSTLGFNSRGKAQTDSTHILAVVKELTKLEHLGRVINYSNRLGG